MIKKIGITYDLKSDYLKLGYSPEETAECDKIETIDAIYNSLTYLGYKVERIGNIFSLTKKLAKGKRWDLIFNICEGIRGKARESQVPSILDAYNIPYTFSDPAVLAFTLHKNLAKSILISNNINTPMYKVIHEIKELDDLDFTYPLFVKPDAEGTSKGIDNLSKVHNKDELIFKVSQILNVYKQSALIEDFLPGREFTVGVVGSGDNSRVFEIMEIKIKKESNHEFYSFENKARYEEFVEYSILKDDNLREQISKLAISAWNVLLCKDGGRIDVRLDKHNNPSFIEVNPLAGLNPEYSDLPIMGRLAGISYESLIKDIMESALSRTNG
ncbi:MAG: ATP-grasp domain-containing protein [Spirochaetales bacterium]|nr:ATP-grasp domain-containing protein [Spirochaetales bacterium]